MPDSGREATCTKPFNSFMGKLEKKCKVIRRLAGIVLAEIHSEVFMVDCSSGSKILFYECIEEMKTERLEKDIGCHSEETMAEKRETQHISALKYTLPLLYLLNQALLHICF